MSTAPTCKVCPIFWGSSSLPLNLNTVLRAITLRLGSWESVPIKLSVKPSLRYSLLGSAVALTKGRTAIELICCVCDFPRTKYTVAEIKTTVKTAEMLAINFREERAGAAAAGIDEEETALASTATPLPDLPESKSRFSRARSVPRSAADCYHRLRSFSNALLRILSKSTGKSGFSRKAEAGAESRIDLKISAELPPRKGSVPVVIS